MVQANGQRESKGRELCPLFDGQSHISCLCIECPCDFCVHESGSAKPFVKKPAQLPAGHVLHGFFQITGDCCSVSELGVVGANPSEEHLVSEDGSEHVKDP